MEDPIAVHGIYGLSINRPYVAYSLNERKVNHFNRLLPSSRATAWLLGFSDPQELQVQA